MKKQNREKTLSTNILLYKFNKLFESKIREKYKIDLETRIDIEWFSDGSGINSVSIGDKHSFFTYLDTNITSRLLKELLDIEDVGWVMNDHNYDWTEGILDTIFINVKEKFNITDPEITCRCDLEDKGFIAACDEWDRLLDQRLILNVTFAKKSNKK